MEVLDQVKETVESLVGDVTNNLSGVQGKAEESYTKVMDNAKSAWSSLKVEMDGQADSLKDYRERITTKFNKHFNKEFNSEEIVTDLKEEFQFFSNELKNSVGRIKESFNK